MRLLFIILIIAYSSCFLPKKNITKRRIEKIKLKSNDCDYFFRKFKKPVLVNSSNNHDLEKIYSNDKEQIILLSYTTCLNGYSKSDVIKLMGQPSETTDIIISYLFFCLDENEVWLEKNKLVFIFNSNLNSLQSIGLISGIQSSTN